MKTCNVCGLQFENSKLYANHVRWKHRESTYHNKIKCEFCNDMYLSHINHQNTCTNHPNNLKECKQCKHSFSAIRHNKNAQFCSHSCSATFNNLRKNNGIRKTKISSCDVCNKEMISKNHV